MTHPAARLPEPAVPFAALAVGGVVGAAALLPAMANAALWSGALDYPEVVRLVVLVLTYGLVAVAAYRRAPAGIASGAAVLWAAALGWTGWGWDNTLPSYVAFAALVLLLDRPAPRTNSMAALLVVAWAFVDRQAAWGILLVLLLAVGRWRDRPLVPLGGAALALVAAWARGFAPWTVLVPTARPWVWADAQATNGFGDPVGLALFGGMLLLVALRFVGRGEARVAVLPLAVFALLAWSARRNGVWLGLVAAPALAALLHDIDPRWRRLIAPTITAAGVLLLLLAVVRGPAMLVGRPLGPEVLRGVATGPVMYRPAFEQALLQHHAPAALILHQSADPGASYEAWQRIANDCDPAAELRSLRANSVVLDTTLDRAAIATLAADRSWRQSATDATATVFVRAGAAP